MLRAEPLGDWVDDLVGAGKKAWGTVNKGCDVVQSPTTQAVVQGIGSKAGSLTSAAQKAAELCGKLPGRAGATASTGYPPGIVARFHEGEGVWWIYPPGSPLSGPAIPSGCANGGCAQAGLGALFPGTPIGKEVAKPAGAVEGKPIVAWYKRWQTWAIVGGGIVVVAGGYHMLKRR